MELLLGIFAYVLIMFFTTVICFFLIERSHQEVIVILILSIVALYTFQGCSKQEFKCDKENIDKTIIQTCNNSNDKEACAEEVIELLSLFCGINKTNLK